MQVRAATPGEGPTLAGLNRLVHELHVAQRPDVFREDIDLDELARTYEAWIADDAQLVLIAISDGPVGFLVGSWVQTTGHTLIYGVSCGKRAAGRALLSPPDRIRSTC